jgi:hypothetical protein
MVNVLRNQLSRRVNEKGAFLMCFHAYSISLIRHLVSRDTRFPRL